MKASAVPLDKPQHGDMRKKQRTKTAVKDIEIKHPTETKSGGLRLSKNIGKFIIVLGEHGSVCNISGTFKAS